MSMRRAGLIVGKWKMLRIRGLEISWLDIGGPRDLGTDGPKGRVERGWLAGVWEGGIAVRIRQLRTWMRR